MNKNILLTCNNISKIYKTNNRKILDNISLNIKYGDLISLIGKSGSGKSTLLYILSGLDTPTSGNVIFENKILSQLNNKEKSIMRNQKIGFIYQTYYLLSSFTIIENIYMPMLIKGIKVKECYNHALKIMQELGLDGYKDFYPAKLSGGEKQRVAIARALINSPLIVFADEPTGNLDSYNTDIIFNLIKYFNNKGTTFLVVTHDQNLSKKMDKIIELNKGKIKFKKNVNIDL